MIIYIYKEHQKMKQGRVRRETEKKNAGETFPGHFQICIGKDTDESSHLWVVFYSKHYLFSEKLRFGA